jgi:hypothetical protein
MPRRPTTPRASSSPQGSVRELREAEIALQSHADPADRRAAAARAPRPAGRGRGQDQPRPAQHPVGHDAHGRPARGSADPAVQRATPKILASLTRAVNLTEATLAFGRAEEPAQARTRAPCRYRRGRGRERRCLGRRRTTASPCPARRAVRLVLRADPEQLHRVLSNLVRNARQAIAATGKAGRDPIAGSKRTAAGGSRSATPGRACRKRRSITCSSRSMAARARAGRASASPSRPRSCAAMAAPGAVEDRSRGHDLRHLPALAGLAV